MATKNINAEKIQGSLTLTGDTSLQNLTTNTISATTYFNLPIKYYAEYSGAPTFSPVVTSVGGIAIGDGAQARDTYAIAIGTNAGYLATGTNRSVFLGEGAGYGATGSTYSTFLGDQAGYLSISGYQSSYIGILAGYQSTGNTQSNFLGYQSGQGTKNLNYSNVMGYQAALNVSNAQHVNYFGHQAGYQATNATQSNFIGFNAGTSATNAEYSNFLGRLAGQGASNASYSTLIGFEAGRLFPSNNIGSNNIIIGNSISLPSGATNSLNIGGVLFGTGLSSASGSDPLITPVNGKLGINVVSPSEALHVSGNTLTTGNGNVKGTLFVGNNTFSKVGYGAGDLILDNSGTDSPGLLLYYGNNNNWGVDTWNGSYNVLSGQLFRFTNNLNESGGAVKMAMDVYGNVVVNGFVSPGAWRAGQVIKDTMLSNTEVTVNATTIATSTSDTDFISYSYTPVSSSSYLIIHYHLASYDASSGTGNDSWISRVKVDGNEITYSKQSTVNGNRSGVLFPLTGRYTNSNTTAKAIVIACRRDSGDDSIVIANSASSMWLRITEIAR